jgi:hypothetical protein
MSRSEAFIAMVQRAQKSREYVDHITSAGLKALLEAQASYHQRQADSYRRLARTVDE